MSDGSRSGRRPWPAWPVRVATAACFVFFAWAVAQFHQPGTGFSSLISIGDVIDEHVVADLRAVPHHVYEHSAGYDGAYYVQIAMHPSLDEPALKKAIDNLPYRARRILFCWVAWTLGLGQPAWIVQAHALLNVLCWFALGWALWKWFPPTSWDRFLRWFGIMFSHGVCMSVRNSLVDVPALLLLTLAVRWMQENRHGLGGAVLALAGLGRETSLLGAIAFADGAAWRQPRAWVRFAVSATLMALPLFAWMAYIRWKFGPADDPGLGNFTLPFAGLAEKWGQAIAALSHATEKELAWASVFAVFAITVQFLFLVLRWRPAEAWWRAGAVFAGMLIFLSTPVWEGFPGAFTRVLLPMTLAFNVLVPRGRRWLPLLVVGNLSVLTGAFEFSPPRDFHAIVDERAAVAGVRVEGMTAWYLPETFERRTWRWSSGHSTLKLRNTSGRPLAARVKGLASSAADARELTMGLGGVAGAAPAWKGALTARPAPFEFTCVLAPGENVLAFDSDLSAHAIGADERKLAFQISNLEISLRAASPP